MREVLIGTPKAVVRLTTTHPLSIVLTVIPASFSTGSEFKSERSIAVILSVNVSHAEVSMDFKTIRRFTESNKTPQLYDISKKNMHCY